MDYKTGKLIFALEDIGTLGQMPWGWEIPTFIMSQNPKWFEDVTINYMDNTEKKSLIAKYFRQLNEAHFWCVSHFPDNGVATPKDEEFFTTKLMPAVENIYTELDKLGVDRTTSAAVFIMGYKKLEEI